MASPAMIGSTLPPELVSLVHHVELNKSGWWDKAVQRLILTSIWMSGKSQQLTEVAESLRKEYQVSIDAKKVKMQVDTLCKVGVLIPMPDESYKISESAASRLEKEVAEGESLERAVKGTFTELILKHCPALDPTETWRVFNEKFLLPLVKEVGANTYQLVAGNSLHLDSMRFDAFLRRYPEDVRPNFRAAVELFLDPKNAQTRSYILRSLNVYFFLEASSLKEETLQALTKTTDSKPAFTIFVDTNYFFSLLGLKSSSDEAANSLKALVEELTGKVTVKLYVLPTTCDETKRVLLNKKHTLSGMRLPANLAEAAFDAGSDSIEQKYFQVCRERGFIPVDRYFEPYISDLQSVMRAKGVELYNADVEPYGVKINVTDDINLQMRFEEKRFGETAKNYEKLRHDMVLWHFVHDKRKPQLESPLEANYWIVTLDYRFIAFDEFKKGRSLGDVPICLHPTNLIQMLQFFVPRTPRLEEAMMSSIRLPFLAHDFDPEAEKVTVSILKTLGRYQDIGDLQPETVSAILMNSALRQKLRGTKDAEAQIKLIREALIQENKRAHQELKEAHESVERLKQEGREKDERNRELEQEVRGYRNKISSAEQRLQSAEGQLQEEAVKRQTLEESVRQLQTDAQARNVAEQELQHSQKLRKGRRRFVWMWVALPLLLLGLLDAGTGILIKRYASWNIWWVTVSIAAISSFVWAWLIDRRGTGNESVKDWAVFVKYHKAWGWVFAFIGLTLSGLLVNALWDGIKALWSQQ